jgi:hypothetical protein
MRAHRPAAPIVLNEFQWIHHTYAIAVMISSSVGMCERGGGHAPGGRGRQRACMSGVGGIESDLERTPLVGVGVDMPLLN